MRRLVGIKSSMTRAVDAFLSGVTARNRLRLLYAAGFLAALLRSIAAIYRAAIYRRSVCGIARPASAFNRIVRRTTLLAAAFSRTIRRTGLRRATCNHIVRQIAPLGTSCRPISRGVLLRRAARSRVLLRPSSSSVASGIGASGIGLLRTASGRVVRRTSLLGASLTVRRSASSFTAAQHDSQRKSNRHAEDFHAGHSCAPTCDYPRTPGSCAVACF